DVVAADAAQQATEQEALFARRERRDQRADVATRIAQVVGDERERLGPARLDQFAVATDHRLLRAILGAQAMVRIAVAIRGPALVDRLVVAWYCAQHLAATRVQQQVGAERIVVADRFARDQFPRARAEAERLVRQR